MKKLILCLFAISTLAFVSCKKDKDYAKDWVGNYSVVANIHVDNLPVVGSIDRQMTYDGKVEATGENAVKLTIGEYTTVGTVDGSGLHVDPATVEYPITAGVVAQVKVECPVIPPLQNGHTSAQAKLTASVMGMSVGGTADIDITKK